jgi:glycosyltransferase involved in cell wall biosynthesis
MEIAEIASLRVKLEQASAIPVLHIIKSLGRGGAEILLPETLRRHNQQKYAFHYIYFLPWKNQVVADIEQAGGKVVCLPARGNMEMLMHVRRIVSYIKKHGIRLIHCHLPWAGIVGRLAGQLAGIPVVYTEHNKWERYHRLTYYANKFSFSRQQKVIAVSGEVAQSIKKHYGRSFPEVQVILNGIDTTRFARNIPLDRDVRQELGIAPDTIVIGIACVFRAQKRLTAWLEVAAQLHQEFPQLRFLIVGDGVLRNEINRKAQLLGSEAYVHFAGLQADTRPWLKAMDIFMMTSEFEGLPIALLEAMSMECMPACTAAGGIPELVHHHKNGLLAPVEDPLQLATLLAQCLNNPQQLAAMKKAARETVVTSFDMRKMVGELEDVYDQLINVENS